MVAVVVAETAGALGAIADAGRTRTGNTGAATSSASESLLSPSESESESESEESDSESEESLESLLMLLAKVLCAESEAAAAAAAAAAGLARALSVAEGCGSWARSSADGTDGPTGLAVAREAGAPRAVSEGEAASPEASRVRLRDALVAADSESEIFTCTALVSWSAPVLSSKQSGKTIAGAVVDMKKRKTAVPGVLGIQEQ